MTKENTAEPVLPAAPAERGAPVGGIGTLEAKFKHLAEAWKREKMFSSSMSAIESSAPYLAIIDLGRPVVPLLIRELEREPDYWFTALHAILGEDPVPPADRGNLSRMTEHWLGWARKNGYVPQPYQPTSMWTRPDAAGEKRK